MGGVVGVDYAALPFLFSMYGIPPEDSKFYFDKLQVMIGTALGILNKKK